jgi:hypothetical protein
MTLRPEQVKAKEYLHAKGTRLAAPQIHERVTAGFAALEAFLDGVTEAEARTRALPGEWTVHEVVDHLVETHRPSLEELRDLLAGRRPPGEPIPALVVATLESAPDTLTDARAPVVMVINVKDADGRETPLHWIEELDWKAYAVIFRLHVLDHLGQARKVVHAARGA